MESRVTVHATLEEMERLFDDTKGGFLVKYYEQNIIKITIHSR